MSTNLIIVVAIMEEHNNSFPVCCSHGERLQCWRGIIEQSNNLFVVALVRLPSIVGHVPRRFQQSSLDVVDP